MTLAITHKFVSAIADDPDATQVRPSNWNDTHAIALANQRVIGRVTAGDGAAEEVTASQLFDWVSSADGSLLTRTGGAWGALANWATDSGDLVATENATPAAAPAGKTRVFGAAVAGRGMLAAIGPTGGRQVAQPFLGQRATWQYSPNVNGTPMVNVNCRADAQGTPTTRTPTAASYFTATKRVGYVSAATAASIAGLRNGGGFMQRGNAAGAGGFFVVFRFAISDAVLVATANMFVGVSATTTGLGDVRPETLTNIVGVGCSSGDTNLQLYAADGTARARTSLGASFPVNATLTNVYELALFCPPNGADIRYEVVRLNTGDRVTGTISSATNLPSATTMLTHQFQRSNGGTAAAVGIDVLGLYGEADL